LKFVTDLLNERDLRQSPKVEAATDEEYDEAIKGLKESASRLSKRDASRWIETLLKFPQLPRERKQPGNGSSIPSPNDLPAGRYAIEADSGELRFYRLWRGTRNPNYAKLYVQHGPDESEVPFKSAITIMKKIVDADPFSCARRYGAEIGCCSKCGLRLTNRVSRLLSIGPICGGRYFADDGQWKLKVTEARSVLAKAGLDPAGNVEDDDHFDYGQEF
jgi:hypothetical protein